MTHVYTSFLHWIGDHRYTRRLILQPSGTSPGIDLCTKNPTWLIPYTLKRQSFSTFLFYHLTIHFHKTRAVFAWHFVDTAASNIQFINFPMFILNVLHFASHACSTKWQVWSLIPHTQQNYYGWRCGALLHSYCTVTYTEVTVLLLWSSSNATLEYPLRYSNRVAVWVLHGNSRVTS